MNMNDKRARDSIFDGKDVKVQIVRPFSDEVFSHVKFYMEKIVKFKLQFNLDDDHTFFRHGTHNDPFYMELHADLVPMATELVGKPIKPSYVFSSMYHDNRSICPLHTDRQQCRYTIDLCVSQKEPWGIYVNDKEYVLKEGEALFYSGTGHPHYRNLIAPGNFCDLIFFHFVDMNFTGPLD